MKAGCSERIKCCQHLKFIKCSDIIVNVHEQLFNKADGASYAVSGMQEGKREAGEGPARSRHCNCGAVYDNVTEPSGRLYIAVMHKSGNLPFCWYMTGKVKVTRY